MGTKNLFIVVLGSGSISPYTDRDILVEEAFLKSSIENGMAKPHMYIQV
jgi:hypothetical protein